MVEDRSVVHRAVGQDVREAAGTLLVDADLGLERADHLVRDVLTDGGRVGGAGLAEPVTHVAVDDVDHLAVNQAGGGCEPALGAELDSQGGAGQVELQRCEFGVVDVDSRHQPSTSRMR